MDIEKLTIQGFKSFYEKSVFTFGKNITGIVGPNGSGKSNITEAIRFVLGEQSAKSMRGKDTLDLLFRGNSGSSNKASVSVLFKKNLLTRKILNNSNSENVFVFLGVMQHSHKQAKIVPSQTRIKKHANEAHRGSPAPSI